MAEIITKWTNHVINNRLIIDGMTGWSDNTTWKFASHLGDFALRREIFGVSRDHINSRVTAF